VNSSFLRRSGVLNARTKAESTDPPGKAPRVIGDLLRLLVVLMVRATRGSTGREYRARSRTPATGVVA
jgi:hypothetical protein